MKKIILLALLLLAAYGWNTPKAFAIRIYTTGFESLGLTSEGLSATSLVNELASSTAVKRTGSASMTLNNTITSGSRNGDRVIYPASTASTTVRAYVYIATYPDAATTIISITGASPYTSNRAYLKLGTTGVLQLFDSGGSQIGSDSAVIPLNTWTRVELKHYHSTGGGIIEARIDGKSFASSEVASTGGTAGSFALGINLNLETATAGSWYYDDVALNNAAGNWQNDYPGEGSVINLYPNATGDAAQGASNGSGSGWDDLDERPVDNEVTYWQLQTDNDTLDVNLENVSPAVMKFEDKVTLVQVNTVVSNFDGGGDTYVTRIKSRSGGTVTSSAAVSIATVLWVANDDGTDRTGRLISSTTPDSPTTPWTQASLNNMQIGIQAPDALPDLFVTSLWATVEFVPVHKVTFTNGRIRFTNGRILLN